MTSAEELLERIDASWHKLRPKLIAGQLDSRLADGRTVKETLAGVAFWNETVAPVFAWMRGQPEPPAGRWYGGADLSIGDGEPWPKDEVHHARESAWARSVTDDEVLPAGSRARTRGRGCRHADRRRVQARSGPVDNTGIDPDHPWTPLTSNERMVSKANGCTYCLYDALIEQLP